MRPAHCRSSRNSTTGRFREATARSTATPARCIRACAVSGSPASGGTRSSAANSGSTAASRPAFGPTAATILIRSRASSSSGSASSSRPSARNA